MKKKPYADSGELILRTKPAGLKSAETKIQARAVPTIPSVPVVAQ